MSLLHLGNAKILNASTGDDILQTNNMTSYQFTVALMLFLVAYSVFEAPSNLALKVFSPRRQVHSWSCSVQQGCLANTLLRQQVVGFPRCCLRNVLCRNWWHDQRCWCHRSSILSWCCRSGCLPGYDLLLQLLVPPGRARFSYRRIPLQCYTIRCLWRVRRPSTMTVFPC